MDDGYSPWSLLLLLGIIFIEIIFYGFGAAIQELSEAELLKRKEEGDKKAAAILKISSRPFAYANLVQVISTVSGLVCGAYLLKQGQKFLLHSFYADFTESGKGYLAMMAVSAVFLVLVLLCIGVLVPKRIAKHYPEKWAYALLPAVRVLSVPVFPAAWAVNGISSLISRLFGVAPGKDIDNVTEEEIMSMVNEGHEQGVIKAGEAEMITNIFEFDDKEAGDIMTHRTNITALDGELTLDEAVEAMVAGSKSRYPVYRENLDDIIGILHLKDALLLQKKEILRKKKLKDIGGLLRKPTFIPVTRNVSKLFKSMQYRKIHMVIVIDEYGQVEGLITMEDILEEIVGDIMDEYDEEEKFIQPLRHGYLIKGMTPLEDVEELLSLEFDEEDYDTINGFLISKLDRIPSEDERPEILFGGYRFSVLKVENKMIDTVKVEKLPESVNLETCQDKEKMVE